MGLKELYRENKTFFKIWIGAIVVLLVAIGVLFIFHNDYGNEEKAKLEKQYGVDKTQGEILVQCANGNYEVYNPVNSINLCGALLTDEIRAYVETLD